VIGGTWGRCNLFRQALYASYCPLHAYPKPYIKSPMLPAAPHATNGKKLFLCTLMPVPSPIPIIVNTYCSRTHPDRSRPRTSSSLSVAVSDGGEEAGGEEERVIWLNTVFARTTGLVESVLADPCVL